MNKIILIFLFIVTYQTLSAQIPFQNKYVKTWKVTDSFGNTDSVPVDTFYLNFQDHNPIDKYSIANSFNGNLGSPIQSKIYSDRRDTNPFIFADPYYPYLSIIESHTFYNTKTPFTELKYLTGGTQYNEEEQFKFLFTANANKQLNFGINLDYLYAKGEYQNQAAKRFAGTLFGTYDSERYSSKGFFAFNRHSNYENGGITHTNYITNPPRGTNAKNIPVNIKGYSDLLYLQFFYNHHYTLGIRRPLPDQKDSLLTQFVPVTRFIHTIRYDDGRKKYFEPSVEKTFYKNTFLNAVQTNDTAAQQTLTNRFAIGMAEEFNKWLKFGLTAFAENSIERFSFIEDSLINHSLKSNTKIGAVLSKDQGRFLHYNFNADITMIGYKAGDFNLGAFIAGNFKIRKDSLTLKANGFVKSNEPEFFVQNYLSNHFKWSNNFSKTYKTHIGGTIAVPTRRFSFEMNVENISRMIYYDALALPVQYDGNVQVLTARLKQDFRLGKFGLENDVVYQLTSNSETLPLPMLVLHHNFYYTDLRFDVLTVQLGLNAKYHTAYYAPGYMPATGRFYNQREMLVGNYPQMNVYGTFHLKRARFFLEYYHVNQLIMKGAYFSMPKYPLFPAVFKMGLTWTFYD